MMAEFENPTDLVEAAQRAYKEGYRRMDAFTPFPVEGLAESIGFKRNHMPLIVLIGGILGLISGYGLSYWVSVIAYPLNIGGRPLHSWPAFIPVTFEMTILFAALFAVLGMLAINGLPTPYHPVFNVPRFALASKDRFFLVIFSSDKKYNAAETHRFLEGLAPRSISEV